jgi:hypothetical protein
MVSAIDVHFHRQAIISGLMENKSAGSHGTLSILGKTEAVLLEKFDVNYAYVSFSGSSLSLPWDKVSSEDMARIAWACGPNDAAMLFHGGALAVSANNSSLSRQIADQLWGVDAAKAKELEGLTHGQ